MIKLKIGNKGILYYIKCKMNNFFTFNKNWNTFYFKLNHFKYLIEDINQTKNNLFFK